MPTLSSAQITDRLKDLDGWRLEENSIKKQFTFPSFPDAVAFIVRLAFDAESADHHPDILVNYRRVSLSYSTHSEGGITEKDFAGARMAEACARAAAARSL